MGKLAAEGEENGACANNNSSSNGANESEQAAGLRCLLLSVFR